MPRRTDAPRDGLRRLTSRLFPSHATRRESAFSWLAADPVFENVATVEG